MEPARARLRLLVGLGNPGRQYAHTRHNAGFWWIERLAASNGVTLASEGKFFGLVGRIGGDCWLLMPQTFMNRSGQSVAALARFYRVAPREILVVHDELDLQPGEVKLKQGGGTAGHNGLRDIGTQLGTGDFWRLRIGIGHPRNDPQSRVDVVDYVLQRPRPDEERAIDESVARSLEAWPLLQSGDLERAMHVIHTRPGSLRPRKPAPSPAGTAQAGASGRADGAPDEDRRPDGGRAGRNDMGHDEK
jgi:PTH1 family peptidyl-tRNA hydrolase